MYRRSGITTTLIATVLSFAVAAPFAQAGSLLSGYGGPGQGNQAILGSALIGGGSGARPPGGGSTGGGASGEGGSAQPGGSTTASSHSGGEHGATGASSARKGTRSATHQSGTETVGRASSPVVAVAPVDSPALGVSQNDLLYILLGLGGLLLAAVLTRRLVRAPR
jgi:hypothetical protein